MLTLLFDIDGTLVNTGGAGRLALNRALEEVFDVDQWHEVEFSGRTDRGIVRDLFHLHGIADSRENWDRLSEAYLRQLSVALPEQPGHVLPGVTELLERLSNCPDVRMGLLTGNAREGARLKLEHYELFHYFHFGGFGDQHLHRNDVAHEALATLRRYVQGEIHRRSIWIIGDTPLDVQCARAIQARVLAVATGSHSREELANAHPDLLLDDLREADRLLPIREH